MPGKVRISKAGAASNAGVSRISIELSPATIKDIDRWAERNGVTRAEAIRRLLRAALAAARAADKLKLSRR
jgi:metal-responsive CopG/Arc/MetJ family transcriptional regulator